MKKAIAIIFVAALMLSIAACGGNASKEELVESAELLDLQTAMNEHKDNVNRAKNMYLGNVYEVSGYVSNISNDHCFIKPSDKANSAFFYVYLSDDDMLEISKGDFITVVGKITSVNVHNITMKNAYLVD